MSPRDGFQRGVVPFPEGVQRRGEPGPHGEREPGKVPRPHHHRRSHHAAQAVPVAPEQRLRRERHEDGRRQQQLRMRQQGTRPEEQRETDHVGGAPETGDRSRREKRGQREGRLGGVRLQLLGPRDAGGVEGDQREREEAADRVPRQPAPEPPRKPQRRQPEGQR